MCVVILQFTTIMAVFVKIIHLKLQSLLLQVFSFLQRVEIFYEYIKADKTELGIGSGHGRAPATYITIHRNRVLENGYEQLSSLPAATIKGIIRVKFINEQVRYRSLDCWFNITWNS